MFRTLLDCSETFMTIHASTPDGPSLTVSIDRAQIATHARPALADLLLRLHIFRCTADVARCCTLYHALTTVDGRFLEWRRLVLTNRPAAQVFVQANTVLDEDTGVVHVREYEASVEGMIASWAERGL